MTEFRRRFWKIAPYILLAAAIPAALQATAVTVRISPGYKSIGVNQTIQYTATVTGLMNIAVTWKVDGVVGGNSMVGTITQTGLYTAPATVPAVSTLVEALASDNKTMGLVYVNVAPAGPTITSVSPDPAPTGNVTFIIRSTGLKKGAGVMINGAVTTGVVHVNSTTIKVSFYVGSTGMIPFRLRNPRTLWGPVYSVQSVAGGAPPATTISPTTASVKLGGTQQFTSNNATSWSATAGTVVNGLYTAPATMPSSNKVTVIATGPGGSASATITLINPNVQQISPSAVTLNLGATQQFTSNGATSWAAVSGAVSNTGFYTAPTTFPASGTDTVTATGPGGSASAAVTLNNSNAEVSTAAARRFLEQAAFGPSPTDAAHVQAVGFQAWLTEQFSMAQASNYNIDASGQGGFSPHFLTNAVMNPTNSASAWPSR